VLNLKQWVTLSYAGKTNVSISTNDRQDRFVGEFQIGVTVAIDGGTTLLQQWDSNISSCTLRFQKISTIDTNIDAFRRIECGFIRSDDRRQAKGGEAKSTRKEMQFGDVRRQRRLCREAYFAVTRRRFRRTNRKRLFAQHLRMNSERLSNNEEMSAVELIRLGKLLKLIPRGRRCWQTFAFPFIREYRVRPVHLPLVQKRYNCKQIEEFANYYIWKHANSVGAFERSSSFSVVTIHW